MCKVIECIGYKRDKKALIKRSKHVLSKLETIEKYTINRELDKLTRNKTLFDPLTYGCNECHVMFDLIIIYKYISSDEVLFVKVGKHDTIFKRDWATRNKWLCV